MKYSKQREVIEQTVKASNSHPTAVEVYEALRPHMPNISLGTVYRNLSLLSENGTLQKISMPDTGDRFDGDISAHSHIVCEKCGAIWDFDMTLDKAVKDRVFAQTGVTVTNEIVLSGLCVNCRGQNTKED